MTSPQPDVSPRSERSVGVTPVPCADRLVWMHMETTGPDPSSDHILSVSMLVTDSSLELCGELRVVIHHTEEAVESMSDWAYTRHSTPLSGSTVSLLDQCRNRARSSDLAGAEHRIMVFLANCRVYHGCAPLCGDGLHLEMGFLANDMPAVHATFREGGFDVSTLREVARRYQPALHAEAARFADHWKPYSAMAEYRHYHDRWLARPIA